LSVSGSRRCHSSGWCGRATLDRGASLGRKQLAERCLRALDSIRQHGEAAVASIRGEDDPQDTDVIKILDLVEMDEDIESGEDKPRFDRRDALDGSRRVRWLAIAFAGRHGAWEARGLLSPSESLDGAIEVRGSGGPFRRILGRAWLRRSSFDLAQRIEETTFFFPFDYRDECAEAEAQIRPLADHGLTLRGGHKTLVGTKNHPDQHNLLYVDRWSGEVDVRRERGPRADVRARFERSDFNLAMTVDGIRYLEARDLLLTRRGAELGWRPFARLRLAGGRERWSLESRHPSYAEIWPFSVWDVFSSTRYRLVAIENGTCQRL
jgi:hypothetical protein